MDFSKWLDLIKLPTRYVVSFALAAAAMLIFLPDSMMETLGLFQLREQYRSWIGLLLVISIAILIPPPIITATAWGKTWIKRRSRIRHLHRQLHKLTLGEKAILRGYLENNAKSQDLDMTDGTVEGLVIAEILFRSSNFGMHPRFWAHNIQPWAWEYLKKHSHLVAGDSDDSGFPES